MPDAATTDAIWSIAEGALSICFRKKSGLHLSHSELHNDDSSWALVFMNHSYLHKHALPCFTRSEVLLKYEMAERENVQIQNFKSFLVLNAVVKECDLVIPNLFLSFLSRAEHMPVCYLPHAMWLSMLMQSINSASLLTVDNHCWWSGA